MQIGTNLFFERGRAQLSALTAKADALNTQVATGKRFTAPSGDVVAYGRLQAIKQGNADSSVYTTNRNLAQSLLTQTDTTLSAVATGLQRAGELTSRAANGTLNDADRKLIAIDLQSVLDDLVNLANTKDARGQSLFAAATGDGAIAQGQDGTVSFTGSGTPASIPVGDGVAVQPTESAARVFGGLPDGAGGTTDTFAVLKTLITALNAGGDVSAATGTAATGITASLTQVTSVQGSVGARGARLDLVASQATDAAGTREIDRSGLEDVDASTALVELQKTMTILQATQASFTKLSQLSLFDYLR